MSVFFQLAVEAPIDMKARIVMTLQWLCVECSLFFNSWCSQLKKWKIIMSNVKPNVLSQRVIVFLKACDKQI